MNLNILVTSVVLGVFVLIGLSARDKSLTISADSFLLADRSASPLSVAASLFTLIGAGELIALSTLAFLFGFQGIFLFAGYSVAFATVGLLSPQIRALPQAKTSQGLVELASKVVGPKFGLMCFFISFSAFFALLMLQFTALGAFLPDATGQGRNFVIVLIGLCTFAYLSVGGLRAVFRTDIFQGFFMIMFIGVAVTLVGSNSEGGLLSTETATAGFNLTWGLAIAGFFVGIGSADVWQRMLAAESDRASKNGFFLGGAVLFIFGILICVLGIAVAASSPEINPDSAFFEALNISLPDNLQILAVALMLAALVSTADTELFVLSSMVEGVAKRYQLLQGLPAGRRIVLILLALTVSAIIAAILYGDLITIYTWLLYVLICLSPILWAAIFGLIRSDNLSSIAVLINIFVLVGLTSLGWLTLENIYLLVIPSVLVTGFIILVHHLYSGSKSD